MIASAESLSFEKFKMQVFHSQIFQNNFKN